MALAIFVFSSFLFLISTVILLGSIDRSTAIDRIIGKVALCTSGSMLCLLILTGIAISSHNPEPIIIERKIEEIRNVAYYFDENDRPVELTGDKKFADPRTTVVHIKTIPGGWKYGIYVTDSRTVELVKKSDNVE